MCVTSHSGYAPGVLLLDPIRQEDPPGMTEPDERERFRHLPEPVRLEDTVESVDTAPDPAPDASDEREVFLRQAGA
jgi:hypothetical protein